MSDAELVRTISNSAAERIARTRFREHVAEARREGSRALAARKDLPHLEDNERERVRPGAAYDALVGKAEELRKQLSAEQAFSRAHADPRNRELANAEPLEN
jgi:hypothetical protein